MITTLHGTSVREVDGRLEHRTEIEFAPGTLPAGAVTYSVDPAAIAAHDASPLPFVPPAYVLACRLGHDLRVDHPLPSATHRGASAVGEVLARWYGWRPAELIAPLGPDPVRRRPRRSGGVGLFFTRGIDSWGAYLDRLAGPARRRPTHLITVDNEVHLDPAIRQAVLAGTARAAEELGLPLITVRTDVRALLDPHTDWGRETHGSVLAGIGLLLRPKLREVVIAPTHWTPLLRPWGSHPELDPWWSVPQVAITHHPGDEPRWRRVERVVRHPVAAGSLQVCWQGTSDRNCGRCEKCLRLLTSAELAGAAEAVAHRFDHPFDPELVTPTLEVNPHPWCDTMDHLDHVGLRADALRQRWEQVARRGLPHLWYQPRAVQPRLPVDAADADLAAVERLAQHLAPLGLRVDRVGPPPGAQAPALVLHGPDDATSWTVRVADGTTPVAPRSLAELSLAALAPLLHALGTAEAAAVPFDPDGQAPPPIVPPPPGWDDEPDADPVGQQ